MFWPRLVLTPEEQKWSTKYYDPKSGKRGVLRRLYQGSLELDQTNRQPVWNFQIARRCRVFALTGIGDVNHIRLQLQDASGEQYFVDPVLASQVFGGWSSSALSPNTPQTLNPLPVGGNQMTGLAMSLCPMVFEPNIVLRPNQVLNIIGTPVLPFDNDTNQVYRVDLCIHVWEFPGYPSEKSAKRGAPLKRNP